MTGIERFLQNHPAFILFASRQGMVEEHHAAEERTHMVLLILGRTGTDDVHAILSADGDVAVAHQASRAIVKLAFLQAIQRIIVGYLQIPVAVLILIHLHVGNHKLGNQPHGMLLVFDDGTAHSPRCTIQVVDILHLVRLQIIHGDARWGGYPEETTTIDHRKVDGRTQESLAVRQLTQIRNLAVMEVEERHILRMSQQQLVCILHKERIDEIARQPGIAGSVGFKLLCIWVENLETATQGSYQEAMVGSLGKAPHTVAGQTAGSGMIGFPHTMRETGQSAIVGSEIQGTILHGGTAHHYLRTQSGLGTMKTGRKTGGWIIDHDALVVGTAPEIAVQILRNGADIAQRNGIEFGR